MLYGLIHARYVLTSRGMNAIAEKFQTAQFGRCPRVLCQAQAVLPVGRSDLPRNYTVNVYCPMCQVSEEGSKKCCFFFFGRTRGMLHGGRMEGWRDGRTARKHA
jgi:hypothetical protein